MMNKQEAQNSINAIKRINSEVEAMLEELDVVDPELGREARRAAAEGRLLEWADANIDD